MDLYVDIPLPNDHNYRRYVFSHQKTTLYTNELLEFNDFSNRFPSLGLKTKWFIVYQLDSSLMIVTSFIHMKYYLLEPLDSCDSHTLFTMIIFHEQV